MQKESKFSFSWVRERITGGILPNERGAKDGRDNYPPAGAVEPAPYQLDAQHYAWEIATAIERDSSEAVRLELETLRFNPYTAPGAGAAERCNAVLDDALGAMDARMLDDHHKLVEASKAWGQKQRDRDYDFHVADAKAPPRGWANKWKSLNLLATVATVEIGSSFFILNGALTPGKAIIWGTIGPVVTMMLGGLAGYLDLRPANRRDRRSFGTIVRRCLAALSAGGAAAAVYALSVYRSVLIDGLSGTGAEIWQRGVHEAFKMAQPETLVLAIIGALGFAVAHRKMYGYFGGFTPRIREADLAMTESHDALVRERDAVIAYVTEPAQQAMANLAGQLAAVRNWAATVADSGDRILMHILEHNERVRVVNDALDSVDQDYRRSNVIVRTDPRPAWAALPHIGHDLVAPDTITEARSRVAEVARAWSAATDHVFAELNRAIRDAIGFIDEVAGLATIAAMPVRPLSLSWRKS